MKTSGILKVVYAIIIIVVTAALGASFTHMHDWTMYVLPPSTPTAFGWVNAIISELTPLAGSLYLMHAHKHNGPTWPAWVMLIYGFAASAIGQVHAAGTDPSFWALVAALLPVVSAFILIKVLFILLDQHTPTDLGQPAQEVVHHPASTVFTAPTVHTSGTVTEPGVHTFTETSVHTGPSQSVNSVEHVDDSTVHTDVHAGQDPCAPPVHTSEKSNVHKPKPAAVNRPKKAVHKPATASVNADREQLRRDVHELRQTMTVRAVADQLGISTGLVNKLSKEPIEPVNTAAVNREAEQELAGVDMDAELARLLAGDDNKKDEE